MTDTMVNNGQKYSFNAEVGKILNLMIHSLYTNKDIFLRELISNSSDAVDKLKFLSITNPELSTGDTDYKIHITTNEQAGTITIVDNGIGMSKEDLIINLGTIAKSGTQSFLEQLTGDNNGDTQLIGQFGVGFYSSFMVADEVIVESRKAGTNESWSWISKGDGEFIIAEAPDFNQRGTRITLKLREDAKGYLDRFKLKFVVSTYSDHISVPISYTAEDGTVEVLNSSSALWTKNKNDISAEDYQKFYKSIAFAVDEPWMILHNKNEGLVEYTNLLFVPSKKPFDLFHPDRRCRVKLYIKKVFISEEVDLIPAYLRFIKGVIDSEDLPLNISRETLQHNAKLEKIKKSLIRRILSEFKKKADTDPEAYLEFWNNFGAVLKEGLCEGGENRDEIISVCRFHTLNSENQVSLDFYISNMQPEQKTIYYLSGDNLETLRNSPQIEGFKSKGIDVILLTDHVDDFWVNVVHEYKDIPFISVTRANIDLGENSANNDNTETNENESKAFEPLLAFIQETVGSKVKEVKLSKKLTDSPACISVPEGAMDIRMEKFLRDQKQLQSSAAKIFEINAKHPIIKYLISKEILGEEEKSIVRLLYDQACIIEGEQISDPNLFAKSLNKLFSQVYAA